MMIPVIVLVILGFVWALFLLGGFYGGYMARRRLEKTMDSIYGKLETQSAQDVDYATVAKHHPALYDALTRVERLEWNAVHAEKILSDFELQGEKHLEPSKLLMRLGPMLGLMGTLIPMGPALVGLASGDIVSMAANMQVAFATTVVGVFIGGVGYLTLLVKKRWFVQDVNSLQYIIESSVESPQYETV